MMKLLRHCEESRLLNSTDLKLGQPMLALDESSDRDSSQNRISLVIGYRLGMTASWGGLSSYKFCPKSVAKPRVWFRQQVVV